MAEEPQVYITTCTLNLKPSRRSHSLTCGDSTDNLCFEWHTSVATPPNTPISPIVRKPVHQSTTETVYEEMPQRSWDLYTPAFTFNEEDSLLIKVDKFMSCERYHSDHQQAMNKRTITNL